MKYSRNRIFEVVQNTHQLSHGTKCFKCYIALFTLLNDFPSANFSIAISAFLNIPDGSPAKFKPNTLTQ